MFDIGGWEFLLIVIIGVLVIGPKELPGVLRTVNSLKRRARELARDFQEGLEEIAREAELDKMGEEVKDLANSSGAVRDQIENTIDPQGEMRDAMQFDTEWRDDDLADSAEADHENPPIDESIDVDKALEAAEAEKAPDPIPAPGAGPESEAGTAPDVEADVASAEKEEAVEAKPEEPGDKGAGSADAAVRKPGAS